MSPGVKTKHSVNTKAPRHGCLKSQVALTSTGNRLPLDTVFRACRAIAVAPVKLHLLSFESARQASTADKIVVFQQDGNCEK